MEKSLLIGGFGGQGVQTLGKLIAYTANEEEKEVTFAPAYGGEMRGGTSNCTVTVSDSEIFSPNKEMLDIVVAMNQESFTTFENRVKPNGVYITNSSLIKDKTARQDITQVEVPFNEISEKIGNDKVLNVVALGFITEYTSIISTDVAAKIVEKQLGKKEKFREMNRQAFEEGVNLARSMK